MHIICYISVLAMESIQKYDISNFHYFIDFTPDDIKNSLFRELFSGFKSTHRSRLYMPLFIIRRFVFVMVIVPEIITTLIKVWMILIVQLGYIISITSKICLFINTFIVLKPFEKSRYNIIDCINELFILTFIISQLFLKDRSSWNPNVIDGFIYMITWNWIIVLLLLLSKNLIITYLDIS